MRGTFFEIQKKKVIPLFDPPDLIRGVRNNLLKNNLIFEKDGKQWTAKWSHIELVYDIDKQELCNYLRMLPKIRDARIKPSNTEKMKVSLCTQVFSQRFSSTMNFLRKQR